MALATANADDRVALVARAVIFAEAVLSLGAAAVLLLWPKNHAELFAFAVAPAMTASFMGANFAGGSAMKWIALTERSWLNIRQSVIGVGAYVAAIGVATLINLNSFNLSKPAALIWIGVYVLLPFVLVAIVFWQHRMTRGGNTNSPRGPALPTWLRVVLAITAAAFLGGAIGLVVIPSVVEPLWPWALKAGGGWGDSSADPTGGMGGYIAGWLLGLAVTLAHATWENDARRSRAVLVGGVVAGLLNIISCIRFADDMRWSGPAAWIYLALLIVLVLVSAISLRASARSPSTATDSAA